MSSTPNYTELTRVYTRLYRYYHLSSIVGWDRNAMMPPRGNEARAAAEAELCALIHRTRTDPQLKGWLDSAEREELDEVARANLREIRRDWRDANALPESLVEAKTLAGARCEHAWRSQRPANDWKGFLENFRPVVKLARQEAQLLADDSGLAPYDALMDRFEPGVRAADIDRIFGDVKTWLPDLINRAQAKQAAERVIVPAGPFPVAAQRALNAEVMTLLGFDFEAGRLDESTHPFSGGVPEDVRLTTRYSDSDLARSLLGTIHETGHARSEQNLPRAWLGQPVGTARSYGVHESQSLSFEMQLARSRAFAGVLAPLLRKHFGDQPALIGDLVDWARTCGFPVTAAGRGHKWLPHFNESTPETVWANYGLTPEQAARGGLNPKMFNSFLDGSKPSIECTAVANATGLQVPSNGLLYPPASVEDIPYVTRPKNEGGVLEQKGMVEVISSLEADGRVIPYDIRMGVWVTVEAETDYIKHCFEEYNAHTDPSGRYFTLYKRWHLIGLEVGMSVASVALRGEATGVAQGWHADVVATAKRDLRAGEMLDGEGGYTVWGKLLPAKTSARMGGLPLGLAHQVKLIRDVKKGQSLCWEDVAMDAALPAYKVRREMEALFKV